MTLLITLFTVNKNTCNVTFINVVSTVVNKFLTSIVVVSHTLLPDGTTTCLPNKSPRFTKRN